MSHFLDNLTYFTREKPEKFSEGMALPPVNPAIGSAPTVAAGRMTRSCAPPMV